MNYVHVSRFPKVNQYCNYPDVVAGTRVLSQQSLQRDVASSRVDIEELHGNGVSQQRVAHDVTVVVRRLDLMAIIT